VTPLRRYLVPQVVVVEGRSPRLLVERKWADTPLDASLLTLPGTLV
jgi:hypothetical protein